MPALKDTLCIYMSKTLTVFQIVGLSLRPQLIVKTRWFSEWLDSYVCRISWTQMSKKLEVGKRPQTLVLLESARVCVCACCIKVGVFIRTPHPHIRSLQTRAAFQCMLLNFYRLGILQVPRMTAKIGLSSAKSTSKLELGLLFK